MRITKDPPSTLGNGCCLIAISLHCGHVLHIRHEVLSLKFAIHGGHNIMHRSTHHPSTPPRLLRLKRSERLTAVFPSVPKSLLGVKIPIVFNSSMFQRHPWFGLLCGASVGSTSFHGMGFLKASGQGSFPKSLASASRRRRSAQFHPQRPRYPPLMLTLTTPKVVEKPMGDDNVK